MAEEIRERVKMRRDHIRSSLHQVRTEQARRAVNHLRCTNCTAANIQCIWLVMDNDTDAPCSKCAELKIDCTLAQDNTQPSLKRKRGSTSVDDGEEAEEEEEENSQPWRALSGRDADLWRSNALLVAMTNMLDSMDSHLDYLPSAADLLASHPSILPTRPAEVFDSDHISSGSRMAKSVIDLYHAYSEYATILDDDIDIHITSLDNARVSL